MKSQATEAYIYKLEKGNKVYVCSTYNNSLENATLFFEEDKLKNPSNDFWCLEAKYKEKVENIKETLPKGIEAVKSKNKVGYVIKHVWRPGLYIDIEKALEIDMSEMNRAKRELRILVEQLYDILMYIEPDNLTACGHKIRELLILACTEVESSWISYMKIAGENCNRLTTVDFVKLCPPLFLKEYKIIFCHYPMKKEVAPFKEWNDSEPTKSLPWYYAYNMSKHNRKDYFQKATLECCLNAIIANIIMFCVRYSPYNIIAPFDICSQLISENFIIQLENYDISSFYTPYFKSSSDDDLSLVMKMKVDPSSEFEREWNILPLSLKL